MSINLHAPDASARPPAPAATHGAHDDSPRTMNLCCLPFGVQARIEAIDSRDPTARRLMEMGVLPGAVVRVIKAAPFGCPLEVEVRGYRLAMRRAEAAHVGVIALPNR